MAGKTKTSTKAKPSRHKNMGLRSRKATARKAPRPLRKAAGARGAKSSHRRKAVHAGTSMDIEAPPAAKLKTRQLGSGTMPRIKHELKVKEVKELRRERGVERDVFLHVPGAEEKFHSRKVPERDRSASGPYPTIVICGLGFAGLCAARALRRQLGTEGRIIGIDASDRFVFIPALMAMAGGFFTREQISAPLKGCLEPLGVEFVHDTITGIDPVRRAVRTKTTTLHYDYCIISLGASSTPLPIGFDEKTLSLRHACDAQAIWQAATAASAEKSKRAQGKPFEVRFGIIGGGPTGVQLASWLKDGLQRHLNTVSRGKGKAHITLFQHGSDLVPGLPKKTRRITAELLIKQGINVHFNAGVKGSADNVITLDDGSTYAMDHVVFCGGWRQSPLLEHLGLPIDPRCGIRAYATLQSIADPYLFAAGDALCFEPSSLNIPGWKRAQNAKLVAPILASNIIAHSRGQPMEEFKVHDTPVILDLRPVSILIKDGTSRASRIFWVLAQAIRMLHLYSVRHPNSPISKF